MQVFTSSVVIRVWCSLSFACCSKNGFHQCSRFHKYLYTESGSSSQPLLCTETHKGDAWQYINLGFLGSYLRWISLWWHLYEKWKIMFCMMIEYVDEIHCTLIRRWLEKRLPENLVWQKRFPRCSFIMQTQGQDCIFYTFFFTLKLTCLLPSLVLDPSPQLPQRHRMLLVPGKPASNFYLPPGTSCVITM